MIQTIYFKSFFIQISFHCRFSLSKDAIAHGLPQIDTSKTAVKDVCPTFLQPVKCEVSRYRTLSGMCNNLDNPSWGSARSAMIRFIPPSYGDGESCKTVVLILGSEFYLGLIYVII